MDNATTVSVGQSRVETTSGHIFERPMPRPSPTREPSEIFDEWFSRCHGPLHFTACRVLGGAEGADLAVQNCWLTASRNPPSFDREGAFRSWLLRVLSTRHRPFSTAISAGHWTMSRLIFHCYTVLSRLSNLARSTMRSNRSLS
jgi:hypothetical protein